MRREAIERQLAAAFDSPERAALLSIYADLLQQAGDPRGELIALDLVLATKDKALCETWPLLGRRTEVLIALIGKSVYDWFRMSSTFEHGFGRVLLGATDEAVSHRERALVSGPLGPYLRTVKIVGNAEAIQRSIGVLLERAYPWLHRLAITAYADPARAPIVDDATTAKLIAATPALEAIAIDPGVFSAFPHPNMAQS